MSDHCLHCDECSLSMDNYEISCNYCCTFNRNPDGIIGYICVKCSKISGVFKKHREDHATQYHKSVELVD